MLQQVVRRFLLLVVTLAAPAFAASRYAVVRDWPALPGGRVLGLCAGVGVDSHGNVFVFHRNERVWHTPFPEEPIAGPTVSVLDGRTGKLLAAWGAGEFIMPHGLTLDREDHVWLTDVGRHQVFKYTHDGRLLLTLGERGQAGADQAHFALPTDVVVLPDGSFYVSDGYRNTRVVKFDAAGRYEFEWGGKGAAPGQFNLPHGIAVDARGRVFVCDRSNSRLQAFDPRGKFLTEWKGPAIGRPYGVSVAVNGHVFTIDGDGAKAVELDADGNVVDTFGAFGTEPGQFQLGHDIAVARDGAVYVAEGRGQRVQKFVPQAAAAEGFCIAVFSAEVTVPIGHGMMGGAWLAKTIADPLWAHGLVLLADGREFAPVVYVAVDWCEIRNEALERWKSALAEAAGTQPERVMVSAIHQHDAPVADLEAERILRARGAQGTVCDLNFHEEAVRRVASALRAALPAARPLTHLGIGQAKVEQVASNRRYTTPDGTPHFDRMSRTTSAVARAAEDGVIDPWLKTLSFWSGDTAIAALSVYAVHPMSYYGTGEISADFPGLARAQRQAETPGVKQIYASGCSGNVTAGKYNDGSRENRAVLAERIHAAMQAAWAATRRHPLERVAFRNGSVRLEPRDGPGWTTPGLEKKLAAAKPFDQCLAALGLSWRKRANVGQRIDLPLLDFGVAQLLVLPGESYVEYQLFAQQCRPESFVVTVGYGEGATGYIPTEKHIAERDSNLADWCWVAPGAEPRLKDAIKQVLANERLK